ncbi:MAG: ketoacyl-ACP synthase III [Deltaproteobacteria bacterium]|nr:ketoacyl-ACP synthase III [Deltaproteobacteria bacterium]
MYSVVSGVSFYVPEKIVTNEDLTRVMDTTDTWIQERTGIRERRIADVNTSTSDLGTLAARKVLEKCGKTPRDLDLLVAATLSPDYYFPGIGVQMQNALGASCIPALDVRGQCSGFAWSIATADALLRTGNYRCALVVGAEIHSRVIEFSNRGRNVSVLFGDGAGAMLLERGKENEPPTSHNKVRGVIDSLMGCDGSGAEFLAVKRPGTARGFKEFISPEEAEKKAYLPYMEGQQVFRHAVTRMLEAAQTILKRNGLKAQDIDLVIPHQANIRINETVREKLELAPEKVFNTIERYGNTTAATLPIGMTEAEERGILKPGALVLTLAFGSGFTWGANLIRW